MQFIGLSTALLLLGATHTHTREKEDARKDQYLPTWSDATPNQWWIPPAREAPKKNCWLHQSAASSSSSSSSSSFSFISSNRTLWCCGSREPTTNICTPVTFRREIACCDCCSPCTSPYSHRCCNGSSKCHLIQFHYREPTHTLWLNWTIQQGGGPLAWTL